ncbi:MAG: hypothetical protein ACI95X_002978 [Paraglaciecola sp.]|jgi:hypothetical protein
MNSPFIPRQDHEHFLSGNWLLNKSSLYKELSFISARKYCSSLFNPNVHKTNTHALAVPFIHCQSWRYRVTIVLSSTKISVPQLVADFILSQCADLPFS